MAVLDIADAGDIAAAMGMTILHTNVAARAIHALLSRRVLRHAQAWRTR